MSDFDITTFRSKPKKTGKKGRRRDPASVSTSFTKYLEKRKALGLDDSDSDSDSDDTKPKKKSQRSTETSKADKLEPPENSESTTDVMPSNDTVESATVTAPSLTKVERERNSIIVLDSDDDDRPATASLPSVVKSPVDTANDASIVGKKKEAESMSQNEPSSLSLLEDFDDLDPDLASSLLESPADRLLHDTSIDQAPANKITLKFQMRLYPAMETPVPSDMQVLLKVLKVYVLDRDPLEPAINAFVGHKKLEGSNLVFIYNNTKVWPIATPVGLGMQIDEVNNIDVYFHEAWLQKLETEKQSRQERLSQMQPEDELSDDEIENHQGHNASKMPEEDNGLFLTIRSKDGKDTTMKVKPTTRIGTLVKHYRTLNNLGSIPIKLMWDDLVLEEDQQIQDTDLENEDMISAAW